MPYKQDIQSCFSDRIGKGGLSLDLFSSVLDEIKLAASNIKTYQNGRILPLVNIVKREDDLEEIENLAKKIRKDFHNLVVLGTGGSSLNPQSIVALRRQLNPDFKIFFAYNTDPFFAEELYNSLDITKTAFLITSKSGNTVEVLAHTLFSISRVKEAGIKDIGKRFFIISDPLENALRNIGTQIGATILNHELNIGGRFSTFTNVGLFPALIAGLNARLFRQGAAKVVDNFFSSENSYPIEGATLSVTAMKSGLPMTVFMPYIESLNPVATWICQVWAESLGKEGKGSTPIRATGTLDQHSQLQLYLDGPADKLLNIIGIKNIKTGPLISNNIIENLNIPYLDNKTFGEVNNAAQTGTIMTIGKKGRPVRLLTLNDLNEESLGALMMHFTLETILIAQWFGINAFDQPAVEDGKILARKILSENLELV